MITIAMATAIRAPRARVWRALSVASERTHWDERRLTLIEASDAYPNVGETARWRYQLGAVIVELRDRSLEVHPTSRLRSSTVLGALRLESTFSLSDDAEHAEGTRLGLKIVAKNSAPVVGGELDRFGVRRFATEFADAQLRAIQQWCEKQPD